MLFGKLSEVRDWTIEEMLEMDQETAERNNLSGWAILEIFGHQRFAGFVETCSFGVASMFRLDVPELPERELTLAAPQWIGGTMAPVGTIVKRAEAPGFTKYFGVGAIYSLTPCDELTAKRAIEELVPRPMRVVSLPAQEQGKLLLGADDDVDDEGADDDLDDDDLDARDIPMRT